MNQKIKPGAGCRKRMPVRMRYTMLCLSATISMTVMVGPLLAQRSYGLKGVAVDTAAGARLANATLYVLRAKDSMLVSYTYTAADGSFAINALPAGHFILLMTYPEYAEYAETVTFDANHPLHDMGRVNMQLKSRLLQEVIIKGQVRAIRIKGDTTEFNARAYAIQPNDKVEDLLKQLPGLQVDKDGKITANGERVTKVLLDGEEFFGDDPTLVTRNIRADMVDKIQLYDKKSDQAAFTGIDDGVKIKTINVKLKADKNTGVFGKAEAGAGTDGLYQSQALFNSFKPREKYAAYATVANNGKLNLGIGDNNRLGASANNVQVGDVIIMPAARADDQDAFNGEFNGRGLPSARTGGLHYDGKWNTGKETVNANYKAGYLAVTGINTVLSEQNLPSGAISSSTLRNFDNSAFRQKLDAAYQISLDSSSALKIIVDGTLKNTRTQSNYHTITSRGGALLNDNTQTQDNSGDLRLFNAGALYTKKFRKTGRNFSWSLAEAYSRNQGNGHQNSNIGFYNAGGARDSTQEINQYKTTDLISSVLSSNMTWSEPLFKAFAIIVNYGIGINNSSADRRTFNPSAPGKYDMPDSVYSNDYRFDQLTNQFGAIFNYKWDKALLNFGAKASWVDFKQEDVFSGNIYRRHFINWAPQANYQYRPSQQKNFSLNYDGSTVQPTIFQVQPVRVNNDPLNIMLGNPDLQPAFSNRLNLRYRVYKPLSGRYINVSGSCNLTSSAIVNNIFTDTTGKTSTQYINLAGNMPYGYSLSTDIGFKIKPVDISVEIGLAITGSHAYSYINHVLNISNTNTYWASVQLQKNVQKKYGFSVVAGPNYTVNEFSLSGQRNNNAAGFYGELSGSLYLPYKFQLVSGMNYSYTAATQTLIAQNRAIWNASLSKAFFKNENLRLSLAANDLLDQNINFTRNITANAITQNSFNSIRRYFMLSLVWDFTRFGTQPAKK